MSDPTITWSSFEGVLADDCDVINVSVEHDVLPAMIFEIVLRSDMTWWKAIAITDSATGAAWEISTQDANNEARISLASVFITDTSRLEFKKAKVLGYHTGVYYLNGLPERIKPGSRVTFHWTRDSCSTQPAAAPPSGAAAHDASGVPATGPQRAAGDAIGGAARVFQLLNDMDKLLSEKYAFDVFAPDSVNFGILVTYRQKWQPLNYQVGDLVSTIPLAPKEIRRYTTRTVTKTTRAVKEVEDSLRIRKTESTDTARVDAEIVEKAHNKTSFNVTAKESIGNGELYKVESTQTSDQEQGKESAQTKKDFRESVIKSAEEYKQQHRTEIDTSESQESETTTFHEIQNPNEELPVTYLFYELQRTYRLSEKIHKLTPVILVANNVPSPHQINDAWLLQHDWILNHVILDDSFRPALEYLTKSFVGAGLNIRLLADSALVQKNLVETLRQQVVVADQVISAGQQDEKNAVLGVASSKQQQGIFDTIKSVFDPAGITGKTDTGAVSAAQGMVDYAKDTLDRAERQRARLQSQLDVAVTALQGAIDRLSSAVKDHFDKITEIDRLRIHIKDNILYYMQAVWSHEPPDQRFFRLYDVDVPNVTPETAGIAVKVFEAEWALADALKGSGGFSIPLPMPPVTFPTKKLVEVADLDNLLGFKGNYMMFPLKQNNYLTLHMMQNYLDIGDLITVRDPDEPGNYTVDEIEELAACVYEKDPKTFRAHEVEFKTMMIDRLTSPRPDDDRVIVPTKSLYIEALLGTHPLLEDFKLIHRALDVKKVQAEVRHAELENIRLAARALRGNDEDPDIEKKIVIETDNRNVTVQPVGD